MVGVEKTEGELISLPWLRLGQSCARLPGSLQQSAGRLGRVGSAWYRPEATAELLSCSLSPALLSPSPLCSSSSAS